MTLWRAATADPTPPADAEAGWLWFDTTNPDTPALKVYDGTANWIELGGGGSGWTEATAVYDFGGVIRSDGQTLTSGTTITLDMTGEPIKWLTLDHNATITVSNPTAGQRVEVRITQDTTGGTAAWSGVTRWNGGAAPSLAATAGYLDAVLLTVEADGSVTGEHLGAAS